MHLSGRVPALYRATPPPGERHREATTKQSHTLRRAARRRAIPATPRAPDRPGTPRASQRCKKSHGVIGFSAGSGPGPRCGVQETTLPHRLALCHDDRRRLNVCAQRHVSARQRWARSSPSSRAVAARMGHRSSAPARCSRPGRARPFIGRGARPSDRYGIRGRTRCS